ncbi:MAG TPA: molybdopterin molybdenumtransferase MoeA [Gammaproteobacteria bacterium]|nr:molybdopterin molybdenumtransferase MoeA [Gammaproteobacteria bacterium]
MISLEAARDIVLRHAVLMGSERIALHEALGRVLAADITARREHPPWDNSAMDGFAVRGCDVARAAPDAPVVLRRVGEVRAGAFSGCNVGAGEAVDIMTGAPLPTGADTVVRLEDTRVSGDSVSVINACARGANVRRRGEDIRLGEPLLPRGSPCRPAEVGLLATAGHVWVNVYQRPRVAVLATGDELAEPGEALGPEKIINSNSFSIAALVREAGGVPIVLAPARDSKEDLSARLCEALGADIVLAVGGVSLGKYDYVKDVLKALGVEMKFWRVKMRPGHPVAFGVLPQTPGPRLFGLPGNPVSCMVAFYQFVRPLMRKMTGLSALRLPEVDAVLDEDSYSRPGRVHLARAVTHWRGGAYRTRLSGDQGSGLITSMSRANSLIVFPEEGGCFPAGARLTVQLLPE